MYTAFNSTFLPANLNFHPDFKSNLKTLVNKVNTDISGIYNKPDLFGQDKKKAAKLEILCEINKFARIIFNQIQDTVDRKIPQGVLNVPNSTITTFIPETAPEYEFECYKLALEVMQSAYGVVVKKASPYQTTSPFGGADEAIVYWQTNNQWFQPQFQNPISLNPSNYNEKLNRQRKETTNGKTYTDASFVVDNTIFYVHRSILAAKSDYFNIMFTNNMKESYKPHHIPFNLEGVTAIHFDIFLDCLYLDYAHIKREPLENIFRVLNIAEALQCTFLKSICLHELYNRTSIQHPHTALTIMLFSFDKKTIYPLLWDACYHFTQRYPLFFLNIDFSNFSSRAFVLLLAVAKKLSLEDLYQHCTQKLVQSVNASNFLDLCEIGLCYKAPIRNSIITACSLFLKNNNSFFDQPDQEMGRLLQKYLELTNSLFTEELHPDQEK